MSSAMEWIAKTSCQWDWETLALFNEKECEISEPVEECCWRIDGGMDISNVSAYSSRRSCSGSDLGILAPKSSLSASTDSSTKLCSEIMPQLNINTAGRDPVNQNKKKEVSEVKGHGTSSGLVAKESRAELDIFLKLGKRTYFEDVLAGSSSKSSSSTATLPTDTALVKKLRMSQQNTQSFYCQVEGCKKDLSTSKEYHRKHQICENHSKSPKVVVAGQERRFCQQCSRFHDLSEFDLNKRSCRKRLSDHNARRRKPQSEAITFGSSMFSESFYDEKQPTNLVFGGAPFGHLSNNDYHALDFSSGFKLVQVTGSKVGGNTQQQEFPNIRLPNNFLSKNSSVAVRHQGPEPLTVASGLDGAPELRRAFSLLSAYSYDPANHDRGSVVQFVNANSVTKAHPTLDLAEITPGLWN